MNTTDRPRTRSTGLRGLTNLEVIAPIRDGLVPSAEPITYVERLRKVLDALHSARQNLRESELLPSFFVDTVARLDIIHHFRYALVPPDSPDGLWRLSLNVTFDGGWEPYMRVIYRDIGPLLDLLFCHNDTYPSSRAPFEQYCDWVRANEVPAGLFYAEAPVTLQDQRYLAELEKAQRERNAADRDFARLAMPSAPAAQKEAMDKALRDPLRALVLPLRTLKGLYRLSLYFPADRTPGGRDDDATLRRFTQLVLGDSIQVMRALDRLPAGTERATWDRTKLQLHDELAWLRYTDAVEQEPPPVQACDPTRLQSHLLDSQDETVTHGCLLLLRVRSGDADAADKAVKTLSALADDCRRSADGQGGIACLVAFTYPGLERLGIDGQQLDAFPQEFFEGIEARHALLGDLRGNHPDRWSRPLLWNGQPAAPRVDQAGPVAPRVDLHAVHVVVQLRMQVPDLPPEDPQRPDFLLRPEFLARVQELDAAASGLRVLAVEPLRTYRTGKYASGHLGVADGLSQPWIARKDGKTAGAEQDRVSAGELLLGYRNDRGDTGEHVAPFLQDGSFLVLRKLRQRMDHLDEALRQVDARQRDEVLAKMMGRRRDGTPLADPACPAGGNAFGYQEQAASDACPFHAHIRRANPRDGRAYTPRILRRGMSYGPLPTPLTAAAERGVMFMAYCASLSEQFETIQRWVAGGNSSGVGSAQADPLLRVPQEGEAHTFRYLDAAGQVVRVDFGDKPLVQLDWGIYLFVPAVPVLRELAAYRGRSARIAATPAVPPDTRPAAPGLEQVRRVLEDSTQAPRVWAGLRAHEPSYEKYRDTAYGHLAASSEEVLAIMRDRGEHYSVAGYGARMEASIGKNILGMDEVGPDAAQRAKQKVVNAVLASIGEREAFEATLHAATAVLAAFPVVPSTPDDIVRKPVDLVNFSDYVLAALCRAWFGVPDGDDPATACMVPGGWVPETPARARCPGNVMSASRYVFTPHPGAPVEQAGREQGRAVLDAVTQWLAKGPELKACAKAMQESLEQAGAEGQRTLAANIAGSLLGFTPTVQGNFLRVMQHWIEDGAGFWERQQDLFEAWERGALSYEAAATALREPLFKAMRSDPVPGMLWRTATQGKHGEHKTVVLGMASALAEEQAPDVLVFGRDSEDERSNTTVHGCPGYRMAMGVLLGLIAGLMQAGTLRPTGSPVLLILTPNT